jgi:hypothetical protein
LKHLHKALLDSVDDLMIILGKEKLTAEVKTALFKLTKTRNTFVRGLNMRLLVEKKANDRAREQKSN